MGIGTSNEKQDPYASTAIKVEGMKAEMERLAVDYWERIKAHKVAIWVEA